MMLLISKSSLVALALAAGFIVFSPASAQVSGLYKDGVLVEAMDLLGDLPEIPPGELHIHGARSMPGASTLQSNAVAERVMKATDELKELATALDDGSNLTPAERETLRAVSDELGESHAALLNGLKELEQSLAVRGLAPDVLTLQQQQTAVIREGVAKLEALLAAADSGGAAEMVVLNTFLRTLETHPLPVAPEPERRVREFTLTAPLLSKEEALVLLERKESGGPDEPTRSRAPRGGGGVPANLAQTPEITFTPEIVTQAAALGNDALAIFEFVRNKTEFQAYLGSRKGAAFTLEQLAGNDVDQASLLLALLRCSGIPSRYVRGTCEIDPAAATAWLGVDHPATAASVLTTAGLNGVAINGPGGVVAVRFTMVWVEAELPINNYRGVGADTSGKAWVPMAPAFKSHDLQPGIDAYAALNFDPDAFLLEFVSGMTPDLPLDRFASDLLAANPGTPLAAIERSKTIAEAKLGLLPASLPVRLLSAPQRFNALEAHQRYRVRFIVTNAATTMIDQTVDLSSIAGKRVMVDYVAATLQVQQTLDSFGGIYETPPNLVTLRPRLLVDGAVLVESAAAVGMGRTHGFDMQFLQPTGASNVQPTVSNTIIAGDSQAIAFDTFLDRAPEFQSQPAGTAGDLFDIFIHDTAEEYLHRVDLSFARAERLMRLISTHDVSEAIVGNQIKVAMSFGIPISFDWEGLFVDADRRIVGPFPVNGDNSRTRPFMIVTGMEGSNLENRVFEDGFEQDAVSTIKILQRAAEANIPISTISTSIAVDSPGFSHPTSVRNAVNAALAQGRVVTIPRDPITVGLWSGTGYSDMEPGGAGGWIISGGISGTLSSNSGGATTEAWPITNPCDAEDVTGVITNPPADAPHPEAVFVANDRRLNFRAVLTFTCEDGTIMVQPKMLPFRNTTLRHGGGNYEIRLVAFGVPPQVIRRFTIVELKKLKVIDAAKPAVFKEAPTDSEITVLEDPQSDKVTINLEATVAPALPANAQLVLWKVEGTSTNPASGSFAGGTASVELDISSGNREFLVKAGCDDNKNGSLENGEVTRNLTVKVSNLDLDVDSDYDGAITDADDDPLELSAGGVVTANLDDDNGNSVLDRDDSSVSGENDLAPIQLGFQSQTPPSSGTLKLEATSGGSRIKLWQGSTKGTPVALPKTWNVGTDTIPTTLYLEGVSGSAAARDVKLKLTYENAGNKSEDEIALTVVAITVENLRTTTKIDASKIQTGEFVAFKVRLRAEVEPASSSNAIRWTLGGSTIKSYEHDIDEAAKHKLIDLETADLENDEISFFWRDQGLPHTVKVAVKLPGVSKECELEVDFTVPQSPDPSTDIYCNVLGSDVAYKNPNGENETYDALTSHENWHAGSNMDNGDAAVASGPEGFWGDGNPRFSATYNGSAFLNWHKAYLDAHFAWRNTFNVGGLGTLPSGPPPVPQHFRALPAGTNVETSRLYGYVRLGEFQNLDQLGRDVVSPWHGDGHVNLEYFDPLMVSLRSPGARENTFWKWHGQIDTVRNAHATDRAAVISTLPLANATVSSVSSVTVAFDLPVSALPYLDPAAGQDVLNTIALRPGALRVNGSNATQVEDVGPATNTYRYYRFTGFTPPAVGQVTVTLAGTASYAGTTWIFTRTP